MRNVRAFSGGFVLVLLGTVYLAVLLARVAWSWRLAPVAPFGREEPSERAFWAGLNDTLTHWSPTIGEWILSAPDDRVSLIIASWLPEALLSASFVGLLWWLYKSRHRLDLPTVLQVRRFGYAFVAIAFFAVPAQVPDFWLSIAWGRMVVDGINPYTTVLERSAAMGPFLRDLPIDPDLPGMTYGPLWAAISALLCATARLLSDSVWIEAILFKGLLAAAWVTVIFAVDRALEGRSHWERAFGVAVAGWLPLGPIQAVAEGHNDAVVVAGVALWIAGITHRCCLRPTLALAASALCKYVTAPLLLLDLIPGSDSPRPNTGRWGSAPVRFAAVLLLTALVFAPFFRSIDMFHSALRMRSWEFLTPREASIPIKVVLETWTGGDWSALLLLARMLPVAMGLVAVVRWIRHREDFVRFHEAGVAILLAVTLSGVGHAWPWFLLWPIPIAAMAPRGWIMRLWMSIALAIPFGFGFVIHGSGLPDVLRFDLASAGCYLLAAAIFVILPRRWFPSARAGTFPDGTG